MNAPNNTAPQDTVLAAQGLVMKFGGITATNNVTLNLRKGARHALIGPNGAGKTTLINLLTGVLQPTEGKIVLEGQDITLLAPHQRVRRGMVRTFQINQLFDTLTPLETLTMVVSQHRGLGGKWWQALGARADINERCEKLLEQFHLTSVMDQETRVLAYGKRRLLESLLRWRVSRACYCWTSRWPVCRPANVRNCCKPWRHCPPMFQFC